MVTHRSMEQNTRLISRRYMVQRACGVRRDGVYWLDFISHVIRSEE